ncbi:MAG: NAD(P)-dependent oxidoreductase [Alphaproteobacteria bacterium]|nr:NAD(P)-dependent oxidoreductase [Alphaproteobacteria bacterium]
MCGTPCPSRRISAGASRWGDASSPSSLGSDARSQIAARPQRQAIATSTIADQRTKAERTKEERDMRKVAFLGLGVMGRLMAGHLVRAGHEVRVFNRTRGKADAFAAEHGVPAAASPAEAVTGAELVFACVGRDEDSLEVARAAFPAMGRGAVYVDHTTASAGCARTLAAEAGASGLLWLDAPVSGGEAGAQKGILTVMAGGSEDAFARAEPVLAAYARSVRLMGPAGAGQLTKMVNQLCIAGLLQSLAEGLHFARRAGLDPLAVVDVISKGAAQSWQMENRAQTMVEGRFDFGFAVEWMVKDLGICLAEGRRLGAHLPVAALVDQFYGELLAMGHHRSDTSSLIARLEAFDASASAASGGRPHRKD